MNARNDHRKATLPAKDYARPVFCSASGLSVTVYGENGEEIGTFDFTGLAAPEKFVKELVRGFCRATGPEGRWRSRSTVRAAASVVRQFAMAMASSKPSISSITKLTPEKWWLWRSRVELRARWPGQINMARALLYEVEGLPEATRRALKQRAKKPKHRTYGAYSQPEFRRIRAASWRVVRQARRRIRANLDYLELYRAGKEPPTAATLPAGGKRWTRGMLLDYMDRTGKFPTSSVNRLKDLRRLLEVKETGHISQALFATTVEVNALQVLFVCEKGYNLSVLNSMQTGTHRADARLDDGHLPVLALDKPRRGPGRRYFTNSLSGPTAKLWAIAEEITAPGRNTLQRLGVSTEALFVGRVLYGASRNKSLFRYDWSDFWLADTWHERVHVMGDDGSPLRITFQRLRLTEQVINQRSSQNSDDVSVRVYRMPDPHTRDRSVQTILEGQKQAIADADAVLTIKSLSGDQLLEAGKNPSSLAKKLGISMGRVKQLLAGKLDTATTACLGFKNSPFGSKGQPCPASFLRCLGCRNAVVTPKHLPRLTTLYDALREIASAVEPDVWASDYAESFSRLESLLSRNATESEIAAARSLVREQDISQVRSLLERRFDA